MRPRRLLVALTALVVSVGLAAAPAGAVDPLPPGGTPPPGGIVTGTVYEPDGDTPVGAGSMVMVCQSGTFLCGAMDTTDEFGVYRLEHVPVTMNVVEAYPPPGRRTGSGPARHPSRSPSTS
jgi:hypothetical protein